ncbi:MAG TPA: TetR family transcriptional regulator [Trueperaceae bacterium]
MTGRGSEAGGGRPRPDDLTARARIRDAAIRRFARDGFAATSVKDIAADAGVSAPLVIHHFGSKDGLRAECDRHVNELVWEMKRRLADAAIADPLDAVRRARPGLPLLEYLAVTLADGSGHVDELVDAMVEESLRTMEDAQARGLVKPTADPRARAVVLTLWQLGALVLHRHARRLLGADLTGPSEATLRWWLPAGEVLAHGVISDEIYAELRAAAERLGVGGGGADGAGAPAAAQEVGR